MALTLAENPEPTNLSNIYDTLTRDNAGWFWCAVRTKPNREKQFVSRILAATANTRRYANRHQRVAYYLPMRQTRSRSRNKILKPVLPGYVFLADRSCSACIYARAAASTTRLSLGALTTKQQYEFRKEIAWFADPTADIRLALERQIGKTAKICWPHRMAGLCGTFTKLDGEGRLTIVLPFMQQTISVAFDENELEFLN